VAEARAGGRCSRWVGWEAARGCPGACGGQSRVDTAEGGPSVWRHSHGEEDSERSAPDHGSTRRRSGMLRDSTTMRRVVRAKQLSSTASR
jgi:hypothetical protein